MANISKINFKGVEYDIKPLTDATPTQGSNNAVRSGGVYEALDGLQAQIPQIDATLSNSGQAADAKETGKVRDDVILDETTLLQAPLSIAKFEAYSYWTFGSRISPTTGITSNNEPAYCRSTWVAITEPILVTMANPDYEWCVWGYSNNASAAGTYSPSPVYSDRPVIIRPIKGTTYFRLSVRRKDLATLTTPYSDQTSDAYKILTSLKTLVLTDDTLSVAGVPADAKAVRDMFAQLTVVEGSAWE